MKKCVLVLLMLFVCCANEKKPASGVVSVNGSWIKKDDIDKIVEMYRQQMLAAFPQKSLEGIPASVKKNIASQLVANELVLQEARKRKFTCDPERLEQTLDGIKKQFPDSASLDRELEKMGQTRQEMRDQVRDGLLIDTLIKSLARPSDTVSLAECKAYYDSNAATFAPGKRYRPSQVMFKVKKDATPAQKKAVADKAAKVLAEIKEGKDFAAAAKKYSEDPTTAKLGGDIGWFKKGDLMPEFDMVAMSLKQNEVSNVFQTAAGLHILKKTGEEALPPQPFDQEKDKIKKMLQLKKQNEHVKSFVDSLMATAKIVYADTSYKAEEVGYRK